MRLSDENTREGRHLTLEERIALQAEEIKRLWQENEQLRAQLDEAVIDNEKYEKIQQKAYHDGRKSAGAEVDSEAVWVAALKELYPFEILKRLKKKELWIPRRDNSGKDRVEVWEYVDTVGEKIKHFREAAGLTQQQLAEKLGVTKNQIWQWEHGYRIPKPETREKIALALDKDPWVLY